MNVLRAQSLKVSTQPRLRFAIPCRWRQLATHVHSSHMSCGLMGSLKRFRAGKVISPVRCGCCSHPWYTVPRGKRVLSTTRNFPHRPARVVVLPAFRPAMI